MVLCLVVSTFGVWWWFYLLLCIGLCVAGCLTLLYIPQKVPQIVTNGFESWSSSTQLLQALSHLERPLKKQKHDKRLTGANIIDEPLQEVIEYTFRDYVHSWYGYISTDEDFLGHLRELVHKVIINCSARSKDVEWVPYLTTRLVDDFASHLRLFRKSQAKLKVKKEEDPGSSLDLLSIFFDKEFAMEQHLCRDLVCTSRTHEIEYLQDLSEILLYLLLPPEDFHNRMLRFFVRVS
ncbi:sorting nexin-13-like [Limulus polyphemus]|uniref:Sorting nexin-13-like n=1 Tax=Limulus polyphemus TaxID=6850 RepID=A0ABM1RX87_LIMPO|nr:sorting nexin-13-like [Limulus polyphemus]